MLQVLAMSIAIEVGADTAAISSIPARAQAFPSGPTLLERMQAIGDPLPGARLLRLKSPHLKGSDVEAWQTTLLSLDASALPKCSAWKRTQWC